MIKTMESMTGTQMMREKDPVGDLAGDIGEVRNSTLTARGDYRKMGR